jgi:hypothetical protein
MSWFHDSKKEEEMKNCFDLVLVESKSEHPKIIDVIVDSAVGVTLPWKYIAQRIAHERRQRVVAQTMPSYRNLPPLAFIITVKEKGRKESPLPW